MSLWEIFRIADGEVVEKTQAVDADSVLPLADALAEQYPEETIIAVPEDQCMTDKQAVASLNIPTE